MPDVFFFGCAKPYSSNKHAWYGPGIRSPDYKWVEQNLPSGGKLDGRWAPRQYGKGDEYPQGKAVLVHLAGHTVVQFWDRTGDGRPNSNSAFVARGHHTFDAMMGAAREAFPRLFKRFTFEVTLIDA